MHERQPRPKPEIEIAADMLAQTFIQRTALYARQLDDGCYVCIKEPLTYGHLFSHLKGDITLGAYVLDARSYSRYLVLDADTELQRIAVLSMAADLLDKGVPSYMEDSRRGGHLWLFFKGPVPGETARQFGRALAYVYDLGPLEIFPKQDSLNSGPGSLIRLPFGVHRKDSKRYGFIDHDERPVARSWSEQIERFWDPMRVPRAAFSHFLSYDIGPVKKPVSRPSDAASDHISDRIKSQISVYDFVNNFVELSERGRGLCPFHDDHHASFSVNIEQNYWHYFAGCGGGSVIDFWITYRSSEFKSATAELAEMLLD
jgi:hypothetical protein